MKRLSIRMRLTLSYGALFLLAGAVVLGVTYLLVRQSLTAGGRFSIKAADLPRAAADQVFAQQQQLQADALNTLLTQGGLALIVVAIAAAGCGWFVAGRALRPVSTITATARRIGNAGRGLHERIALDGPADEVKELADVFDSMLERLDRSFDSQRRFVANASHELRTPLALNRALVELAITRPGAAQETQRLGESLLTVNERHERLIDGLLTLSDSENLLAERSPVDLAEVAAHVTEAAATEATSAGISVESTVDGAATEGDPVLLERMVQNLVENAIRHNHTGGWLSVRTTQAESTVTVTVANTGPAVPPYDVEALFQPFRRLGTPRTGRNRGFGLGLSIVRAVAQSHGGTATAVPRDGGGLVVTVTLPASPT